MILNPIKLLISLSLSFTLIVLLLIMLAVDLNQSVAPLPEPEHRALIEIKKTLSPSNPFKYQRPGLKQLTLTQTQVNLLANMALTHFVSLPTNVELEENHAIISASYKIPQLPVDFFLNVNFKLIPHERFFKIEDLRVGNLPLPDYALKYVEPYLLQFANEQYPQYLELFNAMQKLQIKQEYAILTYRWNHVLARQAQNLSRDVLLSPREQELILIYYRHLSNITRLNFWQRLSLNQLLRPMFEFAAKRTQEGGDAVEENRALLLTMALISTNVRINHLVKPQERRGIRNIRFYRLTLLKRRDLMQHFLISAALTISSNKSFSDTMGLSKEIYDSEEGSGFSFADLLADRAGVRFAEAATQNTTSAQQLQQFMARKELLETDFMPPYDHLPEAITALEFKKRYVDIRHEKYLFVEDELQHRIGNLPLYRNSATNRQAFIF